MRRRVFLFLALAALLAPAAARADDALRVYVIRHANAWKNVPPSQRPGRMSDDDLDALTPAGLAKAEQVGAQLADKGIVAVYCSPARRAQQTAAAIAKRIGLADPPIVADAFRTLDSGTDKDASSGMMRMKGWKAGKDPRPPAGESLADGFARATKKLEELRAKYPGQAIAVVTHGEIAASLLAKAAGRDIVGGYFDHFPDEGSVHEIRLGAR
jgi:ribonuclease H / adenosylcobalamin/alpha-ribazole phosphatase